MKKSLVALAALAVVGAASAQSSVNITGTVDATFQYGSGDVANMYRLGNSGLNSSELVFKGVEDLGGGLKTGFILSAGINNDNGTGSSLSTNNQASGNSASGGLIFNRRSYLQFMGGFGEFRAGRDYTPVFWLEAIYDPFGINGVGTSRAFQGGAAYTGVVAVRASNSVGYLTPSMGGFKVWVQGYMGENLDNTAAYHAGNGGAALLNYDQGPLSLGLGYGATSTGAGTDTQVANLGGTYDFGVAKLNAYVQRNEATNRPDIFGYLVGGSVPMGPGYFRASYSRSDNDTANTNQLALGYVYNFSKLTQMYATWATVRNDGGASQALNGSVTSVNGSSNGLDVGLSKKF